MAAPLDPRRAAPGQSPEPQLGGVADATTPEKSWNPLLVPRDLYLREGLVWQSHQPVSLTVEVNGKRDLTKYAAVMQLVHKQLGFVARLGQPGAAAKFQNLHLIDVKRRGSTDIHLTLGDLAWAQARAAETSTAAASLAPAAPPPSGGASPDISDAGIGATEACVMTGGAAEGGVLSGTSSEGTTAPAGVLSRAAAAADAEAGTSTDSRSHGGAVSDQDEKATGTSAAVLAGEAQASCSAAAAVAAAAATADAASSPGAASAGADAATPAGAVPAPSTPATSVFQCSCAFCPCHFDAEQFEVPSAETRLFDASPHASAVADHQGCLGKGTPASASWRPTAATAGFASGLPSRVSPPPSAPAADGPAAAVVSHISRERLRTLCLPAILKTGTPAVASKAASGPSDRGRRGPTPLQFAVTGSLPPLRAANRSVSASAIASMAASGADAASGAAVELIGWELMLPLNLAAKLGAEKHAMVQYEIDGEVEDCKVQYRLARSDDGRTAVLQGISRPLRGLQLLSVSESADGDILIRAATPSLVSGFASAGAIAAAAAAAAAATAVNDSAVPLSRSTSGRQRRPSLKAREGADDALFAVAASGFGASARAGSSGCLPALPPLYPMHSASGDLLGGLLPPGPQPHLLQQKRRGRPPRSRPPSTSPPQHYLHPLGGSQDDLGLGEQMQDNQEGYDGQAIGFGAIAKRGRTAGTGRAASSSLASEGGAFAGEQHGGAAREQEDCHPGVPPRRRRSVPAAAAGLYAPQVSAAAAARQRRASNGGAFSMVAAVSAGEVSAGDEGAMDADGAAWDGAHALYAAARASVDSASGRVGRKRLSSPVGAVQPTAGLSAKRYRRSVADSFLSLRALEGEVGEQREESPQGSEAVAPAGQSGARGGRGARAHQARRGQHRQHPSSSCSGSSDHSDDDPCASGDGIAMAAAAAGVEDYAGGLPAPDGGTSSSLHRSAPHQVLPPRPKPRARASASKSKNKPIRHPSKITNVVRNAGAILLMIGRSDLMYEKQLRATFGNNPDTSKALRLLEEQGKVVRGGLGYRMHPYHYTLTPVGLDEYDRQLLEQGPSYAFALTMGVQLPGDEGAVDEQQVRDGEAMAEAAVEDMEVDAGAEAQAVGMALTAAALLAMQAPAPGPFLDAASGGAATAAAVPRSLSAAQQAGTPSDKGPGPGLAEPVVSRPSSQPPMMNGLMQRHPLAAAGTCASAELGDAAAQPHLVVPTCVPTLRACALVTEPAADAATAAAKGLLPQSSRQRVASQPPAPALAQQQLQQRCSQQASGSASATAAPSLRTSPDAACADFATAAAAARVSSPSISTPSGQPTDQRPTASAAAATAGPGPCPTTSSAASQQQQAHEQTRQPLQLSAVCEPSAHLAAPGQSPSATAPAAKAAPASTTALTQPTQAQSTYACPVAYQMGYTQAYQQAAQDPAKAVQDADSQPLAVQMPYANPYAAYGYVATPFGYMPYAMYSAYASAAVAAGGASGALQAQFMPVAAALQAVSASPSQHAAGVSAVQASVSPLAVCPSAAHMQPYNAAATLSSSAAASAAGAQLPHVPQQGPQTQVTVSPQSQTQDAQALAAMQAQAFAAAQAVAAAQAEALAQVQTAQAVQAHLAVNPELEAQGQQQPKAAVPPQQLHQAPKPAPQFRFVVEVAGGSWRAEVPGLDGRAYYSPGFASAMQAAAAADLLMSKLRPGEQLNLGINPQEEATLAALTVEQVQAMLWSMSHQP